MSRFRPIQDAQSVLGAVQDEMNRLFDRVWHGGISTKPFDGQSWAPNVDLYEFDDRYMLLAEVPGLDPTSIDITYHDHSLTVRGHKPRPGGIGHDTPSLTCERRYGSFARTVELPAGVDPDQITAKCTSGVLEIAIPKSETSRARTIRVDVVES